VPSSSRVRQVKFEIVATLSPANDPQLSRAWLHLLVLANGTVIQHCGEESANRIEQGARMQYGKDLLAIMSVPGFERPLAEAEIVKALASSVWLARVARLLGTRLPELLEGGHLKQCDLIEQAGIDPNVIADHISASSAWIDSRQRDDRAVERNDGKLHYPGFDDAGVLRGGKTFRSMQPARKTNNPHLVAVLDISKPQRRPSWFGDLKLYRSLGLNVVRSDVRPELIS
jgi:hypothetical protein